MEANVFGTASTAKTPGPCFWDCQTSQILSFKDWSEQELSEHFTLMVFILRTYCTYNYSKRAV